MNVRWYCYDITECYKKKKKKVPKYLYITLTDIKPLAWPEMSAVVHIPQNYYNFYKLPFQKRTYTPNW